MSELDLSVGGCSDLGALAGVDRFMGPFALYNRIAHGVQRARPAWLDELGDLGKEGELATARVACKRHLRLDPDLLFKPDSRPLGDALRYSLDFVTGLDAEGDVRAPEQLILEVKRRTEYELDRNWGPPGSDQVDRGVWCQVQGQLEAIRRDRDFWVGTELPDLELATVAVEVWPRGVLLYKVRRSPIGAELLDELERFVRDARQGIVPAAAAADRDLAAELASKGTAKPRPATEREAELFSRRQAIVEKLKVLELAKDETEALLAQSLAATGVDSVFVDGGKLRFYQKRGRPGWKESAIELGSRLSMPEPEVLALAETHRGDPAVAFGWWKQTKRT